MREIKKQFTERLRNEEKLFIPYIMAGDGGLESLEERVTFLERKGAAAIEIGIPFSDPVADGPTIQKAGLRSLQAGTTLHAILEKLSEFRNLVQIPIIIMTYVNPIISYGISNFVDKLKSIGIDGCIIPDLPIEEEEEIALLLDDAGIDLIRLITVVTPLDRIEKIVSRASGFLYAVTIKGITGVQKEFDRNLVGFLKSVKEISTIPVIAGFGVSNSEQVRELSLYCDGVVVGSKIVDLFYENKLDVIEELIRSIHADKNMNSVTGC
jgi:tryptophan synthase alpha chain